MEIKQQRDSTSYPLGWVLFQVVQTKQQLLARMWRVAPCALPVGMQDDQLLWKMAWQFLRKERPLLFDPAVLFLGYIQKRRVSSSYNQWLQQHSSQPQKAQQSICPLVNEWINKMWFFFRPKKNEILIHVTTWMSLEDILNEISQVKKGQICYNSTSNYNRGYGRISGELLFHRYSFSLGWWKVLETGGGDGCTTLWVYVMPLSYTFAYGKNGKFHLM